MNQLLEYILRPTFVLAAILAIAIVNLWRKRRETRSRLLWLTIPLILLVLLCLPVSAYLALGSLEWAYPPTEITESPATLVVLSGYMQPLDGEQGQAELGTDTYYRCLHAVTLYQKLKGSRIVVTGGLSDDAPDGPLLGDAMRQFLIEHGIEPADIVVENRSRTTHENALESCRLLRQQGIQRIVLVTDAKHMRRAVLCFRKQGMDVVPAPCNQLTNSFRQRWQSYMPSPTGALRFQEAFHEWLGIAYYWLRGWI